ncbi:DUF982 domain-containing protein [Sinorhizobium sp. BG8]|uniref:DUF982 domain-containing protein n=1 Tax=Sinorhizobium sp. BG8 TaxID=2613773 RepID=UPI00193D478D|nr:DUF982 domain-containing protein [Sinorhizobium sp. BG8]QRM55330.1 DUF982 domain-containing protein [Sinorhizobium sp. BG8]
MEHIEGDWSTAVGIELKEGGFRLVSNTHQAAAHLIGLWPDDGGPAFARALMLCADALHGDATHEEFRLAFLAAAEEAGIVVHTH